MGRKSNIKQTKRSKGNASEEKEFTPKKGAYNCQNTEANDWRWYAENEYLVKDAASFSFNYPLGNRIRLGDKAGQVANSTAVPGIMGIYTSPAFGYSDSPTSPINVAAKNIYSYVRHANAGHVNYDSPDLMIYLCAMDNIYSFIAYLKRIYRFVSTNSFTNRMFPVSAVMSMGVDYYDIQFNLANFRYFINSFVQRVGSFVVPASMSYMARHMWMYENLFYDTVYNDKAQAYHYTPEGFFQFDLDAYDGGKGTLVWKPLLKLAAVSGVVDPNADRSDYLLSYEELRTYGLELLQPIVNSEDMGIMGGDILKAFGAQNCYLVSSIGENEWLPPVYSEEVLDQINNATLIGRTTDWSATASTHSNIDNQITFTFPLERTCSRNLTQDETGLFLKSEPNGIKWELSTHEMVEWSADEDGTRETIANSYASVSQSNKLLNYEHGDATPERNMVASRLTNISFRTDAAIHSLTDTDMGGVGIFNNAWANDITSDWGSVADVFRTAGSDTAGFAKVWYYALPNRGANTQWSLIFSEDIYEMVSTWFKFPEGAITQTEATAIAQKAADDFRRAAFVSVFNRHPAIAQLQLYGRNIDRSNTLFSIPFNTHLNDVNYYTILTEDNLINLAETALYSEFNITQYGRAAQ